MFLVVIDSQCYYTEDACLPDLGFVTTAPGILSDDKVLLSGLENGMINKEWKEKLGDVYLVIASKAITGNYHTLPIVSSLGLLTMTYLFAYKVSGNRLASIIGVIVLEASKTFMWYSDSVSYPTTWVAVFLLVIYPMKRKWISPIAMVISFGLKAMALGFLPLAFIKSTKWQRFSYLGILGMTGGIALALNWVRYQGQFNLQNLIYPQIGLYLLDQDMWILAILFPVTALLFVLRHRKVEWSGFLLLSMGYCLLFQYVLPIVSNYNAYGYRMLPFVVFFALSISLIISKKEVLLKWKSVNTVS